MNTVEEVLQQAALAAGEAVRSSRPADGVVEKEGRANFVTAADLASEKEIVATIRRHFPEHDILSEEATSYIAEPLTCKQLWVIDPIDGTSNFRYEREYSAISIGYVEQGEPVAAAVYDPFRDQLFTALRGQGARLNGQKIAVSSLRQLGKATVATDNSYDPAGTRHNLQLMLKLPQTPWYMIRGSAVLAMCDVAAGRVDLYFHTVLKPWDAAAAFLIASEAGATVTGIDGQPVTFMSPHVVMGNNHLVSQFLDGIKAS
jgi:myo-inositol-1(or 4)-monophosphatase